jgi:hypothetical protein
MHGVIEPEQDLVKLTSDDVQQNCAKCVIGIRYAYFGFRSRPSNADGFEHVSGNG